MTYPKKVKIDCMSGNNEYDNLVTNDGNKESKEFKNNMPYKGYLSNCDILLYPASLSNKRKTIFENQISLNGGNIIKEISSIKNYNEPLVLIDDNLIDRDRINKMIEKVMDSVKSSR